MTLGERESFARGFFAPAYIRETMQRHVSAGGFGAEALGKSIQDRASELWRPCITEFSGSRLLRLHLGGQVRKVRLLSTNKGFPAPGSVSTPHPFELSLFVTKERL